MAKKSRSASIDIQAPASAVFTILADPRQHERIDGSGTVRDVVSGPERLWLGAEFGMNMKMGASYETANKVVEFTDDRLIAWRHKGPHVWRYELEPTADGGTRVTETWDLSGANPAFRLVVGALAGRRTQKSIEATLVKLKAAAEADAAG